MVLISKQLYTGKVDGSNIKTIIYRFCLDGSNIKKIYIGKVDGSNIKTFIYRFCLDGSNIKTIIYRFCRILNKNNNMKMEKWNKKTRNGREQLHYQDHL